MKGCNSVVNYQWWKEREVFYNKGIQNIVRVHTNCFTEEQLSATQNQGLVLFISQNIKLRFFFGLHWLKRQFGKKS